MIDLLDTDGDDLYFLSPLADNIDRLLRDAADRYETGDAELPLLRAYALSNRHLTVLVGLYRYYYYQHRLEEAISIAEQAMEITGQRLSLDQHWTALNLQTFSQKASETQLISMARFYLMALKGWAYLKLRLSQIDEGVSALKKILELDPQDRVGAKALLETVEECGKLTQENLMADHR